MDFTELPIVIDGTVVVDIARAPLHVADVAVIT